MFVTTASWCPCGCDSSYTFEFDGVVAPEQGVWLHYTCPQSRERLTFQSFACWGPYRQDWKHEVVKASLQI